MKKTTSILLAAMCVASVGMAKQKPLDFSTITSIKEQIINMKHPEKQSSQLKIRELYFQMGKLYFNEDHDFVNAEKCFDKVLEFGESGAIYYYKANSQFYQKQYSAAIKTYTKAMDMGDLSLDNMVNLYWLRGTSYYRISDYVSAEKDFNKMLSAAPNEAPKILETLAVVLDKQGRYNEALQRIEQLIQIPDKQQTAMRMKADILCEMMELDRCEVAIRQLQASYPKEDTLYLLWVKLCYARGEMETAEELLRRDLARANRNEYYDYDRYIFKAQFALYHNQYDEALRMVDVAVREPMPTYNNKLRGDIYLTMGDKVKALEYYRIYLAENKDAVRNAYIQKIVDAIDAEALAEAARKATPAERAANELVGQ